MYSVFVVSNLQRRAWNNSVIIPRFQNTFPPVHNAQRLVKAPWNHNFAYQILNFEPDFGLEPHTTGERCSQSQATRPKIEAGSNEIRGTSTHRKEFDRLGGIEEYKENLKKQEQTLVQQLQMLNVRQEFWGADEIVTKVDSEGKKFMYIVNSFPASCQGGTYVTERGCWQTIMNWLYQWFHFTAF